MDLIKQNKFIGIIIAILVALNIFSISALWIQSGKINPPPPAESGNPPILPVKLMQEELGFTNEQVQKYTDLRNAHRHQLKEVNDELTALSIHIADEIFAPEPNDKLVDSLAENIGNLHTKIELLRYDHFKSLAQICNAEQKKKLHPILMDVFGRRGPEARPLHPPRVK